MSYSTVDRREQSDMSELQQISFGAREFAENPEPRCPCLLLLDTSTSMIGVPIAELNRGLVTLKHDLASDPLAMKRVESAIVTFGPVRLVSDFQTLDLFVPPLLNAEGDTPMGAAIDSGLELVALSWPRRREILQNCGRGRVLSSEPLPFQAQRRPCP